MSDLNNIFQEWKKKNGISDYDERNAIISERDKAIREHIMQRERFKMITIENYTLNAYAIDTMPIIELLNMYNMIDAYNIDKESDEYLTLKNISAE